jgi:mannosyltransferase
LSTAETKSGPDRTLIALAGIIALAAVIRVALATFPFWFDEIASLFFANQPLARLWSHWAATETNPPLFYSLLHLWLPVAGQSEAAIRMLPMVLGLASIGLAYALARIITGRAEAGLIAAGLLALSPQHVYYSLQVRGYMLGYAGLALTLVAAALVFNDWRRRRLAWLLYGAGLVLALYAHTTFVFFALLLNLGMLVALGLRRPRALPAWAVTNVAVAVIYAWWAMISVWQATHSRSIAWISPPSVKGVIWILRTTFLPDVGLGLRLVAGAVGLTALAIGLRKRPAAVAALIVLSIAGFVTLLVVSLRVPVLLPRTAYWTTLPVIVALAIGLAAVPDRRLRYGLVLVLVLIEAKGLSHWIPQRDPDGWPQAAAWATRLEGHPLVMTGAESLALPLQYYCRKASPAGCPLRVLIVDGQLVVDRQKDWAGGASGYPRRDLKSALDQAYAEGRLVTLDQYLHHDPTPEIVRDGRFRRVAQFDQGGSVEMALWVRR